MEVLTMLGAAAACLLGAALWLDIVAPLAARTRSPPRASTTGGLGDA